MLLVRDLTNGSCCWHAPTLSNPLSSLTLSTDDADDQILLELGKADDYEGEEKNRFIQGLRELLQGFRANKVKDFNTIAQGIVDFRARFLGDKSKILHLEGVTL